MTEYTLSYLWFKGFGEPIRLLFHYKGVPFKDVRLEHMLGKDEFEQAHVDSVAQLYLDYIIGARPFLRAFVGYNQDDQETLKKQHLLPTIAFFMPLFNRIVERSTSGFIANSGITYVDFFVVEMVQSLFVLAPEAVSSFAALRKYADRIYALPQLAKYLKERPQKTF
ncbi:GST protein [Aphelenchoides fujianensis]|nr:GST protein [Aphelenchoides fujianensis]